MCSVVLRPDQCASQELVQREWLRKQGQGCGVSGALAGARERISTVKSIYDQEIVSQI
jgi:hypothetical protein